MQFIYIHRSQAEHATKKQITFVANIVILSPVMAPKNCALLPV